MGRFAPDITTVSNPKIKPARAAIKEIPKRFPELLTGVLDVVSFEASCIVNG
jgi:hypothetical protein